MYNCFYAKEVFYASENLCTATHILQDAFLHDNKFYISLFGLLLLAHNLLFFFILSAINQVPQGSGHGMKPVGVQGASG